MECFDEKSVLVQELVQLLPLHLQSMVVKLRKLDELQQIQLSMIQRIFGLLMLLLQAVMVLHLLLLVLPIQAQGKLFASLTYLVLGMVVVLVPNGTETNLNVIDILVVPMRLRVVLDFEMNQLVLHTGVLGVEQTAHL